MTDHPFFRLDGGTSSLVIAVAGGVPLILHWGPRLPAGEDLASLTAVRTRPLARAALDADPGIPLYPDPGAGYLGVPAFAAHRNGEDWSTRLQLADARAADGTIALDLGDPDRHVEIAITLRLDPASDTLSCATTLRNTGTATLDLLSCASLVLPVPSFCTDLVAAGGRWCRETILERERVPQHAYLAEGRSGRTSHANAPALTLCAASCDEDRGQAISASLAWSGNHRLLVDRLPDGRRVLHLGPLFFPGEIRLAPGASYEAPEAHATWTGDGFNGLRRHWHDFLRRNLLRAPSPRKVHLNTWEAIYFDHDMNRLRALADAAAELGIERFVLDDGWFRGRSDDRRALGDWEPDETKYPNGLDELVAHVDGLGMEFGLWVEPEMVNPDSDLFRAHPDWVLSIPGQDLITGRHQLVLDLARPEVFDYLFEAIDRLLSRHRIGYLKWDMNRDLTAPGHAGRPSVDAQTRALYRLLDALRARHPAVEIESCASGGGRADLGILARTDRVWTSDCNDALERIAIHRGFSLYYPPEIMGAHVGPAVAHTTGRHLDLAFQASVAFFGHFGFELDVTALDEASRSTLCRWIERYKTSRAVLHAGHSFAVSVDDNGLSANAVLAADGSEAFVLCARIATSLFLIPPPLRLSFLEPDAIYEIRVLESTGPFAATTRGATPFLDGQLARLSGAALASAGVQLPGLSPGSSTLFHLRQIRPGALPLDPTEGVALRTHPMGSGT